MFAAGIRIYHTWKSG